MAVSISPMTIPSNTFRYHVDVNDIQFFEAGSTVTPGFLVGFVSGSDEKVEHSKSGGGAAGQDLVGIVLDRAHPGLNTTTNRSYSFNDNYAAGDIVPVAVRGRVVAYADASGVVAGRTVIISATTAGYSTVGTTAGSKIGVALTTQAVSGGKYILEIVRA